MKLLAQFTASLILISGTFACSGERSGASPDDASNTNTGGDAAQPPAEGTGGADAVTCEEGASQPAADGCNTCTCTDGDWGCTEMACVGDDGTACGARAGDTCSDSEYCAYEAGQYCGAADAQATCKPRPEVCTFDHNPVCGCDGKTYSNACAANAAGTGVQTKGECSAK